MECLAGGSDEFSPAGSASPGSPLDRSPGSPLDSDEALDELPADLPPDLLLADTDTETDKVQAAGVPKDETTSAADQRRPAKDQSKVIF